MKKLNTLGDTKIKLYAARTSSGKFVCFKCRLCFHRPFHCHPSQHHDAGKCTTCRGPLHYAGSAFRAPRKRDKKEWAKLEVLIRDGVRFHYCGGNGKLPDTANEARKVRAMRRVPPIFARLNAAGKRVTVITSVDRKALFAEFNKNGEMIYRRMNWPDRYHVAQ